MASGQQVGDSQVPLPKWASWALGLFTALLGVTLSFILSLVSNNSAGIHELAESHVELRTRQENNTKRIDANSLRLVAPRYSATDAQQEWDAHAAEHRELLAERRTDRVEHRSDIRALRNDLSDGLAQCRQQYAKHEAELAHRGAWQRMDAIEARINDCEEHVKEEERK